MSWNSYLSGAISGVKDAPAAPAVRGGAAQYVICGRPEAALDFIWRPQGAPTNTEGRPLPQVASKSLGGGGCRH